MANPEKDQEATIRTFLARFDALAATFGQNESETEVLQARIVELNTSQEAIRGAYAQLSTAAELLGFNLNEEIERRHQQQVAGVDDQGDPEEPAVKRIDITRLPVERPTVRDFILQEADKALPDPVRASSLRERFLEVYGVAVHEKTFGMTLYRLSKETPPRVLRLGKQNWFYLRENDPAVQERELGELFS